MPIQIYKDVTSESINKMRKRSKGVAISESELRDTFLSLVFESHPAFDYDKLLYNQSMISQEINWIDSGRNVIFPNDSLLSEIWKANFNVGKVSGDKFIQSPFESFVLAMPTHIKFDGQVLPSPLIQFSSKNDQVTKSTDLINKHSNYRVAPRYLDDDVRFLAISYKMKTASGRDTESNITFLETDIPKLLKAKNVTEFVDLMGQKSKYRTTAPDEDRESLQKIDEEIQFKLLKIVVGLLVYYSAKPSSITDGLENYRSTAKLNSAKYTSAPVLYRKLTFNGSFEKDGSIGRKNVMHIRRLVHERYYTKDEYKNLAPGTRWIVCGADDNAYTQE